ncbi:MAG: DNA-binding response regulator [Solirubrobacterales bacterium]|nr:DNA-binding response regulator [Solirubrobacterales bacterium]
MIVLAVDDERPALEDLARLLRGERGVRQVDIAGDGREALARLGERHYDALFLDVRMPGLDGLELARALRAFADPPALVFVTAYETAAVQAFELRALDYLMKPVSRARMAEALDRVAHARAVGEPADDVLPVDLVRGGTRLLPRGCIRYLQAHGDYVRVVSDEGRFLLRGPIGEFERRWPDWLRVHRAFLVPIARVVELRPTAVVLDDGSEVPVARRHVAAVRRRLGA